MLVSQRDATAATYATMDRHVYYTVRGGKWSGYFRPRGLPSKPLPTLAVALDPESKIHFPSQRALAAVVDHTQWLECLEAAHAADDLSDGPFRHREASRFISVSQTGAGSLVDMSPDGSYTATIPSRELEVMLQQHSGRARR